ncbi:MAG: TetR/AcrR family transcriptional regulator [Solirubrobacteraceae bacterium]|nr:MAG: TetR/AcrR family transcriptional regulator [Solirubrobacterales bacterium]
MEIVEKLPRGRHRLSREDVVRSQRERLLRAMAEAVCEQGYASTPVADVLRRARVSRETFYEHFANKQECFLAAYDASATILLEAISTALPAEPPEPPEPPEPLEPIATNVADPLDRALAEYLAALAREPAVARTFLVEVYAAGPAALARRVEVQTRFVDWVSVLVGAGDENQRFACEAIVAAISTLVTQRVCAGRTAEMRELHGPLLSFARRSLQAVDIAPPTA